MIKSRSFSLIKGKIRRTKHYKVCIVGGGPVGLVCSSLLSNYGVNHCLVEKKSNPTNHPQAHYMNNRTMEILRDCIPSAFEAVIGQMSNSAMWRSVNVSNCFTHFLLSLLASTGTFHTVTHLQGQNLPELTIFPPS